jgi:hypothetical protein
MNDKEEIIRLLQAGQVIYYSAITDGAVRLINFDTHTSRIVDTGTFLDMRSDGTIAFVKSRPTGYPVCHGGVEVYDVVPQEQCK